MDTLGQGPSSALDSTYGAMLIGVFFAAFFQGLLTVQSYNYFENFKEDPAMNKIIVAVVWVLDSMHLGFICQSAYHYLVTNWGFKPALMYSTWELDIQLTFIGLSCFVCQLFFLNRIWFFCRKNYFVVGFILAICITTLVLDIMVTVRIMTNKSVEEFGKGKAEIIAVFTTGAAADMLIAGLLCHYLRRDDSAFEPTKSVIATVIQYAVATGILTSALALSSIVAYFTNQHGFYFIAIHFNLGRMYTNALLATLNARGKMRMALRTGQTGSTLGKSGNAFIQTADGQNRIVQAFEKFQKNNTSTQCSDMPPFTYTIERVTDKETESDHEENASKEGSMA